MSRRKITVEVDETVYQLLEVLTHAFDGQSSMTMGTMTVERVVLQLIDHAQQGVYRPGSWERPWLKQAFGDDWLEHLEVGDPYGRPGGTMFARPRTSKQEAAE